MVGIEGPVDLEFWFTTSTFYSDITIGFNIF